MHIVSRSDPKVFRNGPFLFGFTTSFRMGQLLRYSLKLPNHPDKMDVSCFMATLFVAAVRKCLSDGGWASKKDEHECGGVFLVGYRGHLFGIDCDFQAGETTDGINAVGCGQSLALGAVHATKGKPPRSRILAGLRAAEYYSTGVRGPFVVRKVSEVSR